MAEDEQPDGLLAEIKRSRLEQEEKVAYEAYLNKHKRLQPQIYLKLYLIIFIVVFITTSTSLIFINGDSPSTLPSLFEPILYLLYPIITIAAITLKYLQPSSTRESASDSAENFARTLSYLDKRLEELKATLAPGAGQMLTEADRARVLANIQAKLESEALSSYVAGIQELITANVKRESVEQLFSSIADRLGREVQDQAKRGNLNLILGIFTTLIGLTVLGYSVFYAPITQATNEILAYFVPRVSLAVLIEVFAYFFLRLYKQSISEIKYFQNEITNIESRRLAIQLASKDPDASLQLKIVEELIKTERNFLMSKDQTTVDLERERLSRSTYSKLITALKDIAKKNE